MTNRNKGIRLLTNSYFGYVLHIYVIWRNQNIQMFDEIDSLRNSYKNGTRNPEKSTN